METRLTELPDSRVRVEVEVPPGEVERELGRSARELGRELRIPGFRAGKAPPEVVLQRLGREAVMERTLKRSLAEWYERALLEAGVRAIGDPELDVDSLPGAGEPLRFSIQVAVRPKAALGKYKGLEVGRHEPQVPEEAIEEELDRLREGFASLEPVERPAEPGDFVLIDFRGTVEGEPFEGGEATDYLAELGAGRLIEGFEEQLAGARAGEQRQIEVELPAGHGAERLAGKAAAFAVAVKEVREKRLPARDDEFAAEASEFDTLAELRAALTARIRHAVEHQIEDEFRRAVVDSAVREARVEVPAALAAARAEEGWERLEHSLAHRGLDPARYLELAGKSRERAIEDAQPDAELALKREAVLEAVAEAESIEVAEEELLRSLAASAEREGTTPAELWERIRATGRDALLRDELRLRKAVDFLAERAKPIPVERARAREKLWTPGGGAEGGEPPGGEAPGQRPEAETPGLWTPGR